MRRHCYRVVFCIVLTCLNLLTLNLNLFHSLNEAVHLLLRLRLCRLNHQGLVYRE